MHNDHSLLSIIQVIRSFHCRILTTYHQRFSPCSAIQAHSANSATTRLVLLSALRPRKAEEEGDVPRIIKLFQPISKHILLLILCQKRIPLSQLVILIQHSLKQLLPSHQRQIYPQNEMTYRSHTRMIRQHDTSNSITRCSTFSKRDLYTGRTPGYEVCELTFTYAE
jgi:hypothetical protein